jgi:hypothetical protein
LYDDAAAQALMDNVVLCLISLHGHLTRRAWPRRLVASRRFHKPSPTVAAVMSCGDIGVISKTNEWSLLERQFDALAHEKSVGPDSIEKIFDMEFRRRFSELINRTRGLSTQNRDIGSHGFYMDLFQK